MVYNQSFQDITNNQPLYEKQMQLQQQNITPARSTGGKRIPFAQQLANTPSRQIDSSQAQYLTNVDRPSNAPPLVTKTKPYQTEDLSQYINTVKRPSNAPDLPIQAKLPNQAEDLSKYMTSPKYVRTSKAPIRDNHFFSQLQKNAEERLGSNNNPIRRLGSFLNKKIW